MNWLEVSLTVDGEMAEAVADVLARYAPNGVVVERGVEFTGPEDEGTPVGPVHVRAYLPDDESLEENRQLVEQALWYLGRIRPLPTPTFTRIPDQNWMEAWKVRYQPISIGHRLIIVPAWMESPDPLRIPVRIDPGMAFGTGTHPTTQLCLELLERFYPAVDDSVPGSASGPQQVIDLGCGSGILAVAALKLGAAQAMGVDIDAEAFKAARENAQANGVSDRLLLGVGSVAEILAGQFVFSSAPLVLANILAPVLVRLLDEGLAKLVSLGGALILSGILDSQEQEVIQAARRHGLADIQVARLGDWVAILAQ